MKKFYGDLIIINLYRVRQSFREKIEIKIIYFVQFCLIVCDTLTLDFLYLKEGFIYFLRMEADFFDPMLKFGPSEKGTNFEKNLPLKI